jgi:hypothetical protein
MRAEKFGAGDGAQTHGLRLGKPTLYQLSYTRDDTKITTISAHEKVFL